MKKSKFLLLGSVASLASIPFIAAKCGETKEEKKPEVDKPKLSETLKSITGNDLGKVQVAEQDKSNKEKIETAIKEAIVTKVPTLKDKELNLNADLSKKSVTVSAKGFEGEVTLKFEIETQSVAKPKLSETLKSITGNDLGKVQVAEQDKSNKEKIETAIKEAIVTKVPTLKDKELNLNADLSKKSVTVSAKGFEGEVTLKFEIETQSAENPSDEMNPGGENQTESDEEPEEETEGTLTEDEEKLIDKNLYNGLTQDENHIWGEDDDLDTPANSGTKNQGTGAPKSPQQGTGAPKSPQQGTGAPKAPQQGTGAPKAPQQGTGAPKAPQQGTGAPKSPQQGAETNSGKK
ncbi:variable surface lipoprotein [Mycoplasmopsis bovis]|uniref:variable surface lipoprotein n=1 Tax=Mycoplasmopsis bovis TaxID=28903 RepID=UPI003F794F8A